jgi:hypothetical protein
MQKFVTFVGLISASLVFGASPGKATTVNDKGTNTTAVSLTGTTNVFTLTLDGTNPGGTLTVGGTTLAINLNGNNPSTSSITNTGTINQNGTGQAIADNGGGQTNTITNGSATNSAATIEAAGNDAIHLSHGTNNETINNYGQILSVTGGQGIDMSGMTSVPTSTTSKTTINNYATGVIEGATSDGLQTAVGGFVYNDGQIVGQVSSQGSGSDGINAGTNSQLTVVNASAIGGDTTGTGSITGAHHGITGGTDVDTADSGYDKPFTMSVTNNAGGTITGNNGSGINIDGVDATEMVTVVNSGTISGDGVTGDGDGVDVDGLVNLTNNSGGKILSLNADGDASEGVTVGGGTIVNSGTIEGETTGTSSYARGITLAGIDNTETGGVKTAIAIQSIYADTTVTNNSGGVITGDSESAITVLGTTNGNHLVTINNAGTLVGKNSGLSERGPGTASGASLNQAVVELDDTSNTYVVNESGTITQMTTAMGTAVAMHGKANTLNITGGTATITGNIAGDTAVDSTLNVNPGAGNSFTFGYSISNFTTYINYSGTTATTGTVTLSGASANSGTTTVEGGKFNVTNTTGSATGTGKVVVGGSATMGGTGIIQPGIDASTGNRNGVTLSAQSTLVSGGTQSGTTAGTGLTLDNTVAGGIILNASVGSANLTFSLGANHSATTMTVLGNATGELKFASGDTITLNDLTNGGLQFNLNTPYLLIQAGTTPNLLSDNNLYAGITTTGGVDGSGNILNGYVTTTLPVSYNGGTTYTNTPLFLNNGDLEVVPEPGTWGMMLGGLVVLISVQVRRQKSRMR